VPDIDSLDRLRLQTIQCVTVLQSAAVAHTSHSRRNTTANKNLLFLKDTEKDF